jgi:hypothetical protein
MEARIGSAKPVTHSGKGVAVLVGRGEGVAEGMGVLPTEGVKVGFNVSEETSGVRIDVPCGRNVLHPTKSEENKSAVKI